MLFCKVKMTQSLGKNLETAVLSNPILGFCSITRVSMALSALPSPPSASSFLSAQPRASREVSVCADFSK